MAFLFEDTRPIITDEMILDDLRTVASELGGRVLPQNRYRDRGRFSSTLVKKRFGSWNGALEVAGLEVDKSRRNIPDEELFDNLRGAWIKLGRQPRKAEMGPPASRFGREPYIRRFGSWLGAMRAFVNSQGSSVNLPGEPADVIANIRFPSLRLRFQVIQRDAFRCVTCGRSPATHAGLTLHLDHVIPFSKGGRTELANLRTTCADCNLGKGDIEPE